MKTLPILGGLFGPPSACSSAPGRLDVFAAGPGNMVWRWWTESGPMLGPAPLPLPNSIPAEGVCVVSSGTGRLEVFAAGAGINTPLWWRGDQGAWSAGPTLPAGANLSPVAVAAVSSGPDRIEVFAAGAGNVPWWWRWDGANWSAPIPLPAGGAGIHAERVAAVSARAGRFDVFAAGANNHLWHWWLDGVSGWQLEDLGGNLPREGVSAVSWGPDRIDVFAAARGAGDNPLQHWWWDGGSFGGPEDLHGDLAPGAVSAVAPAPNRLEVFGVSGDHQLSRWQYNGGVWSGPNPRGDDLAFGDVSAAVGQNRNDIFARGTDNSLRQWPGGRVDNTTNDPWSNLATNWAVPSVANFSPIAPTPPFGPLAGHCYPESLAELVDIVREAERLGRHVRASGSRWSNSDVAVTPDFAVETYKLNAELSSVLDPNAGVLKGAPGNLLHVEAGITLGDLITMLDSRDLALPTLGGASGQTLAGAISTSVHGTDFRIGPIPDAVRAIHLVGPGGVQHWIEPAGGLTHRAALSKALGIDDANIHQDDDWFYSALVSVGSLGIIYSVIIEVVPQYDLIQECEWLSWPAVRARLAHGSPDNPFDVERNRAVNIILNPFVHPGEDRACFFITRQEAAKTQPYSGGGTPGWLLQGLDPVLRLGFEANPVTMATTVTAITFTQFPQKQAQGWANTITTSPGTPPLRGLSLEIALDATNDAYLDFVDEAGEILQNAYLQEGLGLAGWFSLRFVGHSKAYLSPQNRCSRTCMVEFAALQELSHTRKLLARLEAAGRRHGGTQHWGMFDDLQAEEVSRGYPQLDAWRQVRWELTRGGTLTTFDSDFTRRVGLSDPPRARGYSYEGKSEIALWRPSTGNWHAVDIATGAETVRQWGQAGDVPVPGDYDGDGRPEVAIWRPSTGNWHAVDIATGAETVRQWGQAGDTPVPGDYDGDGRLDLAVWRPGNGVWYIIDSSTGVPRERQWGQAGDIPVPGDYGGDGRLDLAVWRPGNGVWYIIDSSTGARREQQWGQAGDIPVPGDYGGDGRLDLAVWRPSNGVWYIIDSSTGARREQQWGQAGDIPVPGDYGGDGRLDLAVWRPSNGVWYIIDAATGARREKQWGRAGDIPAARRRSASTSTPAATDISYLVPLLLSEIA